MKVGATVSDDRPMVVIFRRLALGSRVSLYQTTTISRDTIIEFSGHVGGYTKYRRAYSMRTYSTLSKLIKER